MPPSEVTIAIAALCRWQDLPHSVFEQSVAALLRWHGEQWIYSRPSVLIDSDDVFHARGMIIAAGWIPPRVCHYRQYVLFLGDEDIRTLMSM
jgi:hypothetical protein